MDAILCSIVILAFEMFFALRELSFPGDVRKYNLMAYFFTVNLIVRGSKFSNGKLSLIHQ